MSEEEDLVLTVQKESGTGLFKNKRLLLVKSGFVSYFSKKPKYYVGNVRSLELSGELPKQTIPVTAITNMTVEATTLTIEFHLTDLIDKKQMNQLVEESSQPNSTNKDSTRKETWVFTCNSNQEAEYFVHYVHKYKNSKKYKPELGNILSGYREGKKNAFRPSSVILPEEMPKLQRHSMSQNVRYSEYIPCTQGPPPKQARMSEIIRKIIKLEEDGIVVQQMPQEQSENPSEVELSHRSHEETEDEKLKESQKAKLTINEKIKTSKKPSKKGKRSSQGSIISESQHKKEKQTKQIDKRNSEQTFKKQKPEIEKSSQSYSQKQPIKSSKVFPEEKLQENERAKSKNPEKNRSSKESKKSEGQKYHINKIYNVESEPEKPKLTKSSTEKNLLKGDLSKKIVEKQKTQLQDIARKLKSSSEKRLFPPPINKGKKISQDSSIKILNFEQKSKDEQIKAKKNKHKQINQSAPQRKEDSPVKHTNKKQQSLEQLKKSQKIIDLEQKRTNQHSQSKKQFLSHQKVKEKVRPIDEKKERKSQFYSTTYFPSKPFTPKHMEKQAVSPKSRTSSKLDSFLQTAHKRYKQILQTQKSVEKEEESPHNKFNQSRPPFPYIQENQKVEPEQIKRELSLSTINQSHQQIPPQQNQENMQLLNLATQMSQMCEKLKKHAQVQIQKQKYKEDNSISIAQNIEMKENFLDERISREVQEISEEEQMKKKIGHELAISKNYNTEQIKEENLDAPRKIEQVNISESQTENQMNKQELNQQNSCKNEENIFLTQNKSEEIQLTIQMINQKIQMQNQQNLREIPSQQYNLIEPKEAFVQKQPHSQVQSSHYSSAEQYSQNDEFLIQKQESIKEETNQKEEKQQSKYEQSKKHSFLQSVQQPKQKSISFQKQIEQKNLDENKQKQEDEISLKNLHLNIKLEENMEESSQKTPRFHQPLPIAELQTTLGHFTLPPLIQAQLNTSQLNYYHKTEALKHFKHAITHTPKRRYKYVDVNCENIIKGRMFSIDDDEYQLHLEQNIYNEQFGLHPRLKGIIAAYTHLKYAVENGNVSLPQIYYLQIGSWAGIYIENLPKSGTSCLCRGSVMKGVQQKCQQLGISPDEAKFYSHNDKTYVFVDPYVCPFVHVKRQKTCFDKQLLEIFQKTDELKAEDLIVLLGEKTPIQAQKRLKFWQVTLGICYDKQLNISMPPLIKNICDPSIIQERYEKITSWLESDLISKATDAVQWKIIRMLQEPQITPPFHYENVCLAVCEICLYTGKQYEVLAICQKLITFLSPYRSIKPTVYWLLLRAYILLEDQIQATKLVEQFEKYISQYFQEEETMMKVYLAYAGLLEEGNDFVEAQIVLQKAWKLVLTFPSFEKKIAFRIIDNYLDQGAYEVAHTWMETHSINGASQIQIDYRKQRITSFTTYHQQIVFLRYFIQTHQQKHLLSCFKTLIYSYAWNNLSLAMQVLSILKQMPPRQMEAIFYNIKSHIEPSIAKALEEAYFQ